MRKREKRAAPHEKHATEEANENVESTVTVEETSTARKHVADIKVKQTKMLPKLYKMNKLLMLIKLGWKKQQEQPFRLLNVFYLKK